ncbi:MAG: type 4a pilus biogenesis protein PilO [Thermoleophilia bacterium]
MKKRDIIILAALGIIVLIVAWYFLIISPKRSDVGVVDSELQQQQKKYDEDYAKVKRVTEERNAAQQTSGELLKLNKMVPADSQLPSMIVDLQQSANESGIYFLKIEPGEAIAGSDGNTIIPMELKFQGRFLEVNDFLYRVENYARMEGNDINIPGRLISVITLNMKEPELDTPDPDDGVSKKFPNVLATLGINAYMTAPAPPSQTGSRAAQPAASDTGAAGSSGTGGG